MASPSTADADYGIYSLGALSISGTGRLSARGRDGIGTGGGGAVHELNISVAKLTASGDRYGISATGNVIIDDSNVSARGGECGLKASQNIGISGENSVVSAQATESGGRAVQAGEDMWPAAMA